MSANPFFRLEDFRSLKIGIEGTNLTSQVRILSGGIQLVEIHEAGLVVEVPPRSCSVGHLLFLRISTSRPVGKSFEEIDAEVTGYVEEVDGDPKDRQLVRLAFRQYSSAQWDALLEYFADKQDSANELIRNTRR